MRNIDKIYEIFKKNQDFITRKQIDKQNIDSWFLSDFVRKYNLVKIAKGFYASKNWSIDNYFVFQYKYPKYIFSYQCALYLNELTDRIPFQIEVTRTRDYNPRSIKGDEIVHTVTKEIYKLGIIEKETIYGNIVKVYDAERTICDLIKDRDNQDVEIFVKAINMYNKWINRDLNKLLKYADIMGIKEKVYKIFELIVYVN